MVPHVSLPCVLLLVIMMVLLYTLSFRHPTYCLSHLIALILSIFLTLLSHMCLCLIAAGGCDGTIIHTFFPPMLLPTPSPVSLTIVDEGYAGINHEHHAAVQYCSNVIQHRSRQLSGEGV